MIEKFISCGRQGAEKAALDAAIKLGIALGGWIPKTSHPALAAHVDKYHRVEMPTVQQAEANKMNIRRSDGTLLLSHGRLDKDCLSGLANSFVKLALDTYEGKRK